MISRIIKVEVSVISRSLITLTETLIIPDITKIRLYNNCFIIHCFKENNDKRIVEEANPRALFLLYCVQDAIRELDIAPGNYAMCAKPTDYLLIC